MTRKNVLCLLGVCMGVCQWVSAQPASKLQKITDFGLNPGNLNAYLYEPEDLKEKEAYPLVVALHGCSQSAKSLAVQSGWNHLADQYHFRVLYPETKRINNASKCFNWFRSADTDAQGGETASIKSMIDYVREHKSVDTERVFVYGLSAGAAMGVSLMANFPEKVTAGAIFAGGPYGSATTALEGLRTMSDPPDLTPESWAREVAGLHSPSQSYPKLILLHGLNDRVVNVRNTHELVDQWTALHHTDARPDGGTSSFAKNPLVQRSTFQDSKGQQVVILYLISEMGHALPIDPGKGPLQGGKKGRFTLDIDFFSTYYVAKDFGLIPQLEK